MSGAFPPSSITHGTRIWPQSAAKRRPVSTPPMKTSFWMPLSISAAPTSPRPWTTPKRSSGRPGVCDLVGAFDERVAVAEEALGALLDREHAPGGLRLPRARDGLRDVVARRDRDLADELSVRGGVALDRPRRRRAVPVRVRS